MPTNARTRSTGPASPSGSSGNQRAGSWNTTTSPRWKSVIFCTTTRSPSSSVFCIDAEGMLNISPDERPQQRADDERSDDHEDHLAEEPGPPAAWSPRSTAGEGGGAAGLALGRGATSRPGSGASR